MQKITPFLWFDDKANEAARFYTSVFKNSTISEIRYNGEAGPRPNGSVMSVTSSAPPSRSSFAARRWQNWMCCGRNCARAAMMRMIKLDIGTLQQAYVGDVT
jgi:predicted 3-demethylubiquinone-9 3-methyltransferase (glyoxalase superfamily)